MLDNGGRTVAVEVLVVDEDTLPMIYCMGDDQGFNVVNSEQKFAKIQASLGREKDVFESHSAKFFILYEDIVIRSTKELVKIFLRL